MAAPASNPAPNPAPALAVEDLRIEFPLPDGRRAAVVDGVSLSVETGHVLGLVGESGSGKSMIALAALGLVPAPGRVTAGRVVVAGRDLARLSERELRAVRGREVGIVFQDPMTGLNPVRRVGSLLVESLRRHSGIGEAEARARALDALKAVGIPAAESRLDAYPHQLSGGLRQRVTIALALVNRPRVILADEPTTALDATIQAQILDLLRARVADAAAVLITHDLGVAATICDRIAVIYAGRIVETGPAARVLSRPRHPYTAGLLAAAPRFDFARRPLVPIPGQPPRPGVLPAGCAFAPRCPRAAERCRTDRPPPPSADGSTVACWFPTEAAA
jgi:oligopeptide/dipeptide ABC transporter ATP-binding protein